MNNAVRLVIFAILVGGLAVLAFFKLKSNQKEVEAKVYRTDPNAAVFIQVDTLRYEPFDYSAVYLGSFAPNKESIIASESPGRVIESNIQEGSTVAKGQVIARLDTDILQDQLKIAEGNFALAQKTAQRMVNAASGLTEVKVDEAQTQVNTLKYQIELYKKQISMATIKAPFNGVVTAKYFEIGSLAGPGAQMAVLTDISTLKLQLKVPENDIRKFKKGATLSVSTDVYPEHTFSGIVDLISVKADASRNFTVEVRVVNNASFPLKAGMFGTVNLRSQLSNQSISIPRTALLGSNKKPEVYVIQNGVAKVRQIILGAGNDNSLQVLDGLKEGEIIAVGGLVNLTDGSKVSISEK